MRTVWIGVLLATLSFIAGVTAILFAEFGAPSWVFILLLGWLWTFGLPSFGAILLSISLCEGRGLLGFFVSAAVLAVVFQCTTVWLVDKGIGRLRSRRPA